jgi:hypothetical protein
LKFNFSERTVVLLHRHDAHAARGKVTDMLRSSLLRFRSPDISGPRNSLG